MEKRGSAKKEEQQYEKQRATWPADKRLSVQKRLEKRAKRKEKNRWFGYGIDWRRKTIETQKKWGPSSYQRWQLYAPDGREVSVAASRSVVTDATLEIEPQPQEPKQEKAEKREQGGREYETFRAKHLTGS